MYNFLFFIISFLIVLPKFVHATEFTCEINKNGRTSTEYLVKWINPKTIHKLIDNKIILHNVNKTKFLDRDKYVGKILSDNVKKMVWEYHFPNELIRSQRGQPPRSWHKNDLFIMRFELRKSNNTVFFEGFYKNKKYRWVQGIGKCSIDDTKAILEAKLKEQKLIEEKNKRDAELEVQRLADEKRKRDAELEAQRLTEEKAKRDLELEVQRLAEEKRKRDAELEVQRLAEEKAKRDAELKAQKLAKEKAKRDAELKAQRLAKEKTKRDARIKAEKLKKAKKIAEEKARKLAQEKAKQLKLELKSTKQKADNFYNDVNEFVKSGGDLDLLELSELYDLKPNPNNKWTKQDLTNFKNLENFVRKSIEFNSFEENKIVERKVLFEQKKSEIILSLNNNLNKLNVLFRENFSVKEFSKPIKQEIKKIKEILNNEDNGFVIETATIVLNKSSKTIELISNKINNLKIVDDNLNNYKVELNKILRNKFGTDDAKSASKFIKKIDSVQTVVQKENLNNQIQIFLDQNKVTVKKNDGQQKSKTSNQKTTTLTKTVKSDLKSKNTSQFPLKKEKSIISNMKELKDGDNEKDKVIFSISSVENAYLPITKKNDMDEFEGYQNLVGCNYKYLIKNKTNKKVKVYNFSVALDLPEFASSENRPQSCGKFSGCVFQIGGGLGKEILLPNQELNISPVYINGRFPYIYFKGLYGYLGTSKEKLTNKEIENAYVKYGCKAQKGKVYITGPTNTKNYILKFSKKENISIGDSFNYIGFEKGDSYPLKKGF